MAMDGLYISGYHKITFASDIIISDNTKSMQPQSIDKPHLLCYNIPVNDISASPPKDRNITA